MALCAAWHALGRRQRGPGAGGAPARCRAAPGGLCPSLPRPRTRPPAACAAAGPSSARAAPRVSGRQLRRSSRSPCAGPVLTARCCMHWRRNPLLCCTARCMQEGPPPQLSSVRPGEGGRPAARRCAGGARLRLLPVHREEGGVEAVVLDQLAEARRRVVQAGRPAAAVQRDHVHAAQQVGPELRRALRLREPGARGSAAASARLRRTGLQNARVWCRPARPVADAQRVEAAPAARWAQTCEELCRMGTCHGCPPGQGGLSALPSQLACHLAEQ